MCGIVGGMNIDLGDYDLPEALALLRHRGPDSNGRYIDNQVFLGHTRLSIQDTSSAGSQPLSSEDGRVVIVYNGEIYNTLELKVSLQKDGYNFKGNSDTEVILNLYLRDGLDLLSKLNGIFAFAIWDKGKESLFIARDGMGVKPLYYSQYGNRFLFSSELKALLLDREIDRGLNHATLVNHLVYLWSPGPGTMLHGVSKLEPGHALLLNDGKIVKKWQHYEIPCYEKAAKISMPEAIQETRRLVKQAISRQLLSDVPLGAFLSGGLDSSAIVAFAAKQSEHEFRTFSIDLMGKGMDSEGNVDDLPYAKSVASHLGVELNVLETGPDIINSLDRMLYHLEEPQADPAALHVLSISSLARQHGIKVLLSGAGGDDIFTGYRRHHAVQLERYWSWMPMGLKRLFANMASIMPVNSHMIRRLVKVFQYAELSDTKRLISYFYWLKPEYVADILAPEFKRSLATYDVSLPMMETLSSLPQSVDRLNKMLFLEQKHYLTDHNLNYTDKMGMAESVEIRVPFLDPDLMQFAASLPVGYKQHGKVGKWVFKKAMEGILPNEIIYRKKTGFSAPVRYWLRNELRGLADDLLSEETLLRRGIFSPEGVMKLRDRDMREQVDASYSIFSMICIEMWQQTFLD